MLHQVTLKIRSTNGKKFKYLMIAQTTCMHDNILHKFALLCKERPYLFNGSVLLSYKVKLNHSDTPNNEKRNNTTSEPTS